MMTPCRRFFSLTLKVSILTSVFVPQFTASSLAKEVLTVYDVARIRLVTSVKISPSGRFIAYTLSVPRRPGIDEDGPAWSELHVVDTEGSSRPFVTGEINVAKIDWTPDGKAISFLAKRNEEKNRSLYVIPVDGGEARRLIEHSTSISAYDWHPSGKQIAFLATEPEEEELKKLKKKGFKAEIYEENLRNLKVWMAALPLGENKPKSLPLEGSASELHWGPKAERLVVALAPTPLIDDDFMNRRLHIIAPRDGKVLLKINNPGKLGPVRWSPDGSNLAFCSGEDIHDPSPGRLMVASTRTGDFRGIMSDYLPDINRIDWQDAETILFWGEEGCHTAHGSVSSTGADRDAHSRVELPIVRSASLASDAKTFAIAGSTPSHPTEVFLLGTDNPAPRRLTNSNPWLKDKRLAKQEVIQYTARDGESIEGVLIHPLDAEPGQRYPLILMVHGGPESHVANGWRTRYVYPGQVAAARGFAVLFPNYRGSTGRGVPFAKAHQADYAGKEFNDLIDGVDYLIEKGLVDEDKVGVTGGSYGGFASAWCATYHTKRFAASVMFVGISDQISKSGTTDIANEMFLVHARKRPWDDWQFFLKRSPIYYVEQARTPILILHGKEDPRVHPSQSMELYRHLKILGKTPARLVFYPGEGHGNRKAAARLDYNIRMLRWMEHYLKGPGGDPPPNRIDYGLEDE